MKPMERSGATHPEPIVALEPLEPRWLLSGDVVQAAGADAEGPCAPAGEEVTGDVLDQLVEGNNAFAFDMYQALRDAPGSLFFSPFSISAALSMTYAGAAGQTAQQMADVLHFTLPGELHHAAFGRLIGDLTADDGGAPGPFGAGDPFTLNIANSLWGLRNYRFRGEFLDTLADRYDSPMRPTDFDIDPEGSRRLINRWVSDNTQQKINDLLPPGSIDPLTRAVLANAIYFNASWRYAFSTELTLPFHLADGDVDATMMTQTEHFGYAEGAGCQALEMPYLGGASMVILLPGEGQLDSFEGDLSAAKVRTILGELRHENVHVTMPQFECRLKTSLARTLQDMGMPDAFSPAAADFSAMTEEDEPLWIGNVIHEAWIATDKDGTEAAAATAVIMVGTSWQPTPPPPIEFTVDRPFIYLIRDQASDTTLFVGRVSDADALTEGEAGPEPARSPRSPRLIRAGENHRQRPQANRIRRTSPPTLAQRPFGRLLRLGRGSGGAEAPAGTDRVGGAARGGTSAAGALRTRRIGLLAALSQTGLRQRRDPVVEPDGIRTPFDALELPRARRASLRAWASSAARELDVDRLTLRLRPRL